jgi:hypothetical protein
MMRTNSVKIVSTLAGATSGLFLALAALASPAAADPLIPIPPPPPAPAVQSAATDPSIQAAGTDAAPLPPEGVPHLPSPDALPPGSTMDPTVMGNESPNVSYLKDLWHAVQNQEISGKEALLLGVAQRGMNTPIPEQAPGPNVPISPADAPVPPPAPPAPAPPWLPAPPASPLPPTP